MRLNLLHPPREDPLAEARGLAIGCVLAVCMWVFIIVAIVKGCEAGEFRAAAEKALADPALPEVKRDLFRQGLSHNWPERACQLSYYHPREAGAAWDDWDLTCIGTNVRPGVASCTVGSWDRWGGAWLWVKGYGVCHVEDRFPMKSAYWFDLAVPGPPEAYPEWLASTMLADVARAFGKRPATFVVLKPRNGWPQ